ncbi:MAG TPA: serine/threonine-protein kinase, partial [Kofleriaceae bacterium]|nr:serine/threonine-protein kinase [Kofleriaceae bacterium]
MEAAQSDSLVGTLLAGRYEIDRQLGDGAMGVVYRARHTKMGRPFAVKVLRQRLLSNPKVVRRFEREAELAGRLHHPNVVSVVDLGVEAGHHYMVMDFAPGDSLAALLPEAPMDAARVIALARQLCDGLQHAHDLGLVHRDFKPENVIVGVDERGVETARIVDFGVAILREAADSDRLTTAGMVVGTPHYMAPEQALGKDLDHRCDLFALGIILYELLTGKLPFDGDGVDIARANLSHATPPMGTRVPTVTVDPLLEALVRKLLEKNRDKRPASARETRELLDLIEHHRFAAARLLGVDLPEPAYEPIPELELPADAAEPVPVAVPELATAPVPRASRRRIAAISITAIALLAAAITTAELAHRPAAAVPVPAAQVATLEMPALPPTETSAHDDLSSPSPAHPAITAPARPMSPVGPGPATPELAAPSANDVALLYGSVGRELKDLERRAGEDATIDLWP